MATTDRLSLRGERTAFAMAREQFGWRFLARTMSQYEWNWMAEIFTSYLPRVEQRRLPGV